MTLHELMNACNVHPEVEITLYNMASFADSGKYEEIDPAYFNREVSYFEVVETSYTYRAYINRMKIYLKGE